MSSGFNHAYLMNPDRRSGVGAPDYLRYMFSRRVEVEPGSTFCYSSADSDLAGRMLEQAAGMRLGEYLYGMIFPSWIRVGLFGNVTRKVIRLQAAGSTCRLQIC